MEHFVVKFYTGDEGPTIKGNGMDGLRVGETREDAEEFAAWVNALIDDCERKSEALDVMNSKVVLIPKWVSEHIQRNGGSGRLQTRSINGWIAWYIDGELIEAPDHGRFPGIDGNGTKADPWRAPSTPPKAR